MDAPSSFAPGMTILVPAIGTEKASDQEFAWNIGTTGRIEPAELNASASMPESASE